MRCGLFDLYLLYFYLEVAHVCGLGRLLHWIGDGCGLVNIATVIFFMDSWIELKPAEKRRVEFLTILGWPSMVLMPMVWTA